MSKQLLFALGTFTFAAIGLLVACTGSGPKDVNGRSIALDAGEALDAIATIGPRPTARPQTAGMRARVVVKASSRALAITADRIYYGDADDDGLFWIAKETADGGITGGDGGITGDAGGVTLPVRLARRAPVANGLAVDGAIVTWVATPGDVVFRLPTEGATTQPIVVREKGIFADVTASNGDIFVAEANASGGVITRITGTTATKLATLDGAPRSIVVDGARCWVTTSSKILAVPRQQGTVDTLATGVGFDATAIDEAYVYVVALGAGRDAGVSTSSRVLLRIAKAGGPGEAIASDVRAPIAAEGGEVFYFDGQRSRLMAVSSRGGEPRVIGWDDSFGRPNALAADRTTIYVATGEREDGAVLAIARH